MAGFWGPFLNFIDTILIWVFVVYRSDHCRLDTYTAIVEETRFLKWLVVGYLR
jgi:hypothetical protein